MPVTLLMNPDTLTWDDFLHVDELKDPESGKPISALTNFDWDLPGGKPVRKGDKVAIGDVTLMLSPDCKIWSQSEALKDKKKAEALLAHEQLHYDVIQMLGRVVAKELSDLQVKDAAALDTATDEIMELHFRKRGKKIHNQYDEETKHGLDKKAQEAWHKLVKKTLATKNATQLGKLWL